MSEFLTPTDIGNRALQHCGAEMMDETLGFTEPTKRARQVSFVYGKLRRAELRRNIWRFAIRKAAIRPIDTTTLLLAPTLWGSTTTYFVGSIVADEFGTLWASTIRDNLNNDPENTNAWEPYFGPLTVMLYDSTTSYFSGELVYTAAGDGTYRVFLSIQNGNSDNPATATDWDATSTYMKDQVVTRTSVAYISLIDLNINNDPALAPALYDAATSYSISDQVGASDGTIYTSVTNANLGNDPVIDGGTNWTNTGVLNPWSSVFVGGSGSLNWLQIGGAEFPFGVGLTSLNIVYPLGSGPVTQTSTRNVYHLPSGYVRKASQHPKAGNISYLGGPYGLNYDDWELENDYFVTADAHPIVFRFVADVTDVTNFDDMFCEGLAARIALEVCEPLTQSSDKLKTIASLYKNFMGDARTVNAIEIGAEEPALDDYIACRA